MITLKLLITCIMSTMYAVNGKPSAPLPVMEQTNIISSDSSVANVPISAQVGTAMSKTIHYAETPVVTGYTSTILKPDLSAFNTPLKLNFPLFRPVKTLIPKIAVESQMPIELPIITADSKLRATLAQIPDINSFPLYYTSMVAPVMQ